MPDVTIDTVVIADRPVRVKQPTETQLILIGRHSKKAEKAGKAEEYKDAVYHMADALDIIDSLIVEDEDREYIIDLMSSGKLEIDALLTFISADRGATKTAPKPRVSRAKTR